MKKFLSGLLCCVIIATGITVFAADSIKLIINGVDITGDMEVKPQTIDGEVVVPVSVIAEAFGAVVEFDETTNTVTITKPMPVVPVGDVGTRLNPIPVGTTVVFDAMSAWSNAYKTEMTVTEVIRGDEALELVKSWDKSNRDPDEGKEYILVKFLINGLESKDDAKIDVNIFQFILYSEKFVASGDPRMLYGLGDNFPDFYQGSEVEGYFYHIIDKGDNPSILYRETVNGGIWFSTNIDTAGE